MILHTRRLKDFENHEKKIWIILHESTRVLLSFAFSWNIFSVSLSPSSEWICVEECQRNKRQFVQKTRILCRRWKRKRKCCRRENEREWQRRRQEIEKISPSFFASVWMPCMQDYWCLTEICVGWWWLHCWVLLSKESFPESEQAVLKWQTFTLWFPLMIMHRRRLREKRK